jgi:hypothetical protein
MYSLAQSSNYTYVRDGDQLPTVLHKDQYDPSLGGFIGAYNSAIDQTNLYAHRKEDQYVTLSTTARIQSFFTAALFLVFAVAGSVGEAAFQLRQEMKRK